MKTRQESTLDVKPFHSLVSGTTQPFGVVVQPFRVVAQPFRVAAQPIVVLDNRGRSWQSLVFQWKTLTRRKYIKSGHIVGVHVTFTFCISFL